MQDHIRLEVLKAEALQFRVEKGVRVRLRQTERVAYQLREPIAQLPQLSKLLVREDGSVRLTL